MILSDKEAPVIEADSHTISLEAEQEKSVPAFMQFIRLFKRDIWCWINAVQKLWWLFAIFPLLFACIMFFVRTMTTTNVYVANCGLIRQEIKDNNRSVLPPGYVNVQRSIILNLFKSRAVLEETIKRLSLPYTSEQLYNNIAVRSEKNSDYYFISASSKDPTISAALTNTLADVFIEEYKKLIRRNLEDLNDSYIRTQNELEKQLADQDEKLKKLSAENNLTTIENDIAFNNQRLLQVEDQLTRTSSTLDSAKQALFELQGELANTPEEIVSRRETSSLIEEEVVKAENLLREYEQVYAKNNPLLIQQREIVRKLKEEQRREREEDEEGENDINKKVVISRNQAYTQILVAIAAKKAEITTLTNDIKLNNDNAIQLRARRELLASLQPTLRQLEADILQTKDQINNTKMQISTINSFLDRSFSDISIQELAKTPNTPLGRKRGLWTVIGFILGTFLALTIILACEFFNLTIRSNVDIEQALRIRMLGMIPVLEQAHRADYYSALQTMTSNGKPFFSHASPEHPLLIVFAPNKQSDLDEKTLEEFCETLKIRMGSNYVIISPISEEEFSMKQMPLLINDYLYQFTDTAPKPGKDHKVFFRLDDLSFVSPLTDEQIQRVKTAYKSVSLIVWDLFDFELHRQLFAEIAHNSDLTIIPMKYAKTSKLDIFRILQFVKSFQVRNIVGFLYNVNNKHYSKVTL
jgi:capsular polysaccharide biosynthesis protein